MSLQTILGYAGPGRIDLDSAASFAKHDGGAAILPRGFRCQAGEVVGKIVMLPE